MPTLAELRAIVRRDPAMTTDTISDVNLNSLLNEGAVDLADKGTAFIIRVQWDSAASTSEYVLSGASAKVDNYLGLLDPDEFGFNGLIYVDDGGKSRTCPADFKMTSQPWLDMNLPGWRDADASDTLKYVALGFNTNGYLVLNTYPKAETAITNAFTLYYKSRGTDMSADANYPWTNTTTELSHLEPYMKGIAYYALWQLHKNITGLQNRADYFQAEYLRIVLACKNKQKEAMRLEIQGNIAEGMYEADQEFGGLS